MARYFFDLGGEFAARDVLGHECEDDREATAHAEFIAHRIGTEKPELVQDGNFISARNEAGHEIIHVALASSIVSQGKLPEDMDVSWDNSDEPAALVR